ncbi:MAG TPA: hypothetical protein DCS67_10180 [Clostridiales bacterium UBA8960]|nr:hypothetical protein [Clostridiales bacterium UBA8960]
MYDIRDILRKGLMINQKKMEAYQKLQENSGDVRMRILIGVFIRALEKDVLYLQKLIDSITDSIAETIDFGVFDKVSNLVNQFSRTIVPIDIKERRALSLFVLDQEKASYALLVDIQGRMVTSSTTTSIAYYVLLELIDEKRKFIEELSLMVGS